MARSARRSALGGPTSARPVSGGSSRTLDVSDRMRGSDRPGRPPHLPALDGLRGIAVMAVIAYHLGRLPGGFTGVDVFFVLSGFLITRLLVAERLRTGTVSLRGFWARRIRRLLPAMAVTAVGVVAASRRLLPPWQLGGVRADALAAIGFVANWRLVLSGQSYIADSAGPSPLRHTWSLAVEEQFYLFWPVLIVVVLFLGRRHVRAAVALVSLATLAFSGGWMILAAGRGVDLDRLYYGTDSRVFAMAIGANVATWFDPLRRRLAAEPERRGRRSISALLGLVAVACSAGIVGGFLVADETASWMYRGGFLAMAVLAGGLIVGSGLAGGLVDRFFCAAPLRWLGARSYGLYLFSWPIQRFVELRFPTMGRTGRDLLVVTFSILTASLSYVLVERPVLDGRFPRPRLPRQAAPVPARATRPLHPAVVLTVAVIAATFVWVGTRDAAPAPTLASIDETEVLDAAAEPRSFGEDEGEGPSASETTEPSRGRSGPEADGPFDPEASTVVEVRELDATTVFGRPLRVSVFGDSVALSAAWEVGDLLPDSVEVRNHAVMGCGLMPIEGAVIVEGREPRHPPTWCERQTRTEQAGFDIGPDVALLWYGTWDIFDQLTADGERLDVGTTEYETVLRERIQERVDAAAAADIAVLGVLIPCFDRDPEPLLAGPRTPERIGWFNEQLTAVARDNPGRMRILDPREVLCPDGEPLPELPDGSPVRPDGTHFEPESAAWLWHTWLAPAVASAFSEPTGTETG